MAEAYLIKAELIDERKDSKRAVEGDIVYEATILSRIGVIIVEYSVIPLGDDFILLGEKSTVGASDFLGGGLGLIAKENLTIKTWCLLSNRVLFRGHISW